MRGVLYRLPRASLVALLDGDVVVERVRLLLINSIQREVAVLRCCGVVMKMSLLPLICGG